jgi:hypothetical protein
MVHLPQPMVGTDGSNLFDNEFTWDETVCFRNLEFIADRFDNLSFSPKGNDSGAVFVGMAHNGSPSLYVILKESASEDNSAPSDGESSNFLISRGCNVVTLVVPIATTPPPGGHPAHGRPQALTPS